MQQSLANILFPEYRRRVLGLLLLHPDDALHGREIASRTGLPAGTITRELTKLADVSVGLPNAKVIVLDALRKQRNLAGYSGDLVSDAATAECLASAQELLAHVRAWLAANRPELM